MTVQLARDRGSTDSRAAAPCAVSVFGGAQPEPERVILLRRRLVPAGQQLDQHRLQLLDDAGSQRLTERGHGGVEVHESPNDRGVPPTSGPALGGDPPRIRSGWSCPGGGCPLSIPGRAPEYERSVAVGLLLHLIESGQQPMIPGDLAVDLVTERVPLLWTLVLYGCAAVAASRRCSNVRS
jgi:hypothetical protein